MSIKRFSLILIFILLLFLIPSSFAMDNNMVSGNGDSINELINDNIDDTNSHTSYSEIYVSANGNDDNEGSYDNPISSIKKAINISSNNSKIYISEGIYKENNMSITKSLEIYGIGNVIIDAESESRIFTINTGVSDKVILSGITFTNGKAYQGGAIYVRNAETTISDSKFINNLALTEGGAIYWNSDYGTLINTIIESNTARDGSGVSWGGINSTFTGGDNGKVINCTFINNHLTQDDDACIGLSIYSNYNHIINSTFINHNAIYNSSFGVLYINGDYSTVQGCIFANNEMTMTGAVGFDGNYVEAFNNKFINNTISFENAFGGAIGIQSETISVYNNTFIGNGGDNSLGGAIFINTVETFQFSFMNVSNNVFINNKAHNGGGIYATSNSNFLEILLSDNTFIGNKAVNGAGIFVIDIYEPLNITNNEFENLTSDLGASIYSYSCTMYISNNKMKNCISKDGGTIYSYGEIYSNLKLKFNDVIAGQNKSTTLTAILTDDMGNNISSNYISFTVNGEKVNGVKAINSITTTFDKKGEFTISGSYEQGNAKVEDGKLKIINGINLNVENITVYGKNAEIKVSLTNISGSPISNEYVFINLNGNDILLITNTDGIGKTTVNLEFGSINLTVRFVDDVNYASVNSTFTITSLESIEATDLIRTYNSGADFKAKFYDIEGILKNKDVLFTISGKIYTVKTDSNGIATLNAKLLNGIYDVTLFNPITNDKLVKTLKILPRITGSKNINMYYSASSSYKIRLYDDNGNPVGAGQVVTIKVNGKSVKVKTDKNGYATYKINLNPNIYTITATYKGFKVSNKIVVKKVLSAKNLSKKKAKKIKFQVKLSMGKKVLAKKKIKFKIKGKTYTSKTNNKGIATVTLKNLKVGKYTIYSYYGNSKIKNTIKIRK